MQNYLWKYLSLEKFISILENSGMYFSTIKNLKCNLDPEECCVIDFFTNYKIKELSNYKSLCGDLDKKLSNLKKTYCDIKNDVLDNIFVCSFTNDVVENYALWKIYPTDINGNTQINQGIAIKIDINYFKKLIENPCFVMSDGNIIDTYRVFLKEMDYKSRSEIIELAKLLDTIENCHKFYELLHSLKLEYYNYEKEVRAIIQMFSENKNNCTGGFLKLNLNELFDIAHTQIILSPYAQKNLYDYVNFLLKKHGINKEILINQSSILIQNPFSFASL